MDESNEVGYSLVQRCIEVCRDMQARNALRVRTAFGLVAMRVIALLHLRLLRLYLRSVWRECGRSRHKRLADHT